MNCLSHYFVSYFFENFWEKNLTRHNQGKFSSTRYSIFCYYIQMRYKKVRSNVVWFTTFDRTFLNIFGNDVLRQGFPVLNNIFVVLLRASCYWLYSSRTRVCANWFCALCFFFIFKIIFFLFTYIFKEICTHLLYTVLYPFGYFFTILCIIAYKLQKT